MFSCHRYNRTSRKMMAAFDLRVCSALRFSTEKLPSHIKLTANTHTHTSYLNMMPLHVMCCISEETIHDETLRIDAVNEWIRRLDTQEQR